MIETAKKYLTLPSHSRRGNCCGWVGFVLWFIIVTVFFLAILWDGYHRYINITFEPVNENYYVTTSNVKTSRCTSSAASNLHAIDILWDIELTNKQTGDKVYGRACASTHANDWGYMTYCDKENINGNYQYNRDRLTAENNFVHWFCYKCHDNDCSDSNMILNPNSSNFSRYELYVSKKATYTALIKINNSYVSTENVHYITFNATPPAPSLTLMFLWIVTLLITVIPVCCTGLITFHDNADDIDIINDNRKDANIFYLRKMWVFKVLEIYALSFCNILGTFYVLRRLTFIPYSNDNAFIIQVTFYFWIVRACFELTNWLHCFLFANTKKRWYLNGHLPILGHMFRLMFLYDNDDDNLIKFVLFHDMNVNFYTIMNALQLICVTYYYYGLSGVHTYTDGYDTAYFALLCVYMAIVFFDFVYKKKLVNDIEAIPNNTVSNETTRLIDSAPVNIAQYG